MIKNLAIILVLTSGICHGQNLIPNWDFEQYSACPTSFSQLNNASNWINPATNVGGISGTPDYFNACASSGGIDVPTNNWGTQIAHSGNGYIGILLYQQTTANYREYIETQFSATLQNDSCYHFEMYVNLGDDCQFTSDDIQVYFSSTVVTGVNNFSPLPYTPQISNNAATFFNDVNWTLVQGDYTANGTENYLIIGNFKNDLNTTLNSQGAPIQTNAYVYIDDVSLSKITCTTGINETNSESLLTIYPNPFNEILNLQMSKNKPSEIILYDLTSKIVLHQEFVNSTLLNTQHLAKGIYFYEVRSQDGSIRKGKLVKN